MMLLIVVVNSAMAAITTYAGHAPADIIAVGLLTAPMIITGVLANIACTDGWAEARSTLAWLFSSEKV